MSIDENYKNALKKIESKQYNQAEQILIKALNQAEDSKDTTYLMKIYAELGKTQYFQSQFDTAIKNYENSLEFARTLGNEDYQIKNMYNMALVYQLLSDRKSATEFLNKAKDLARQIEDYEKHDKIQATLNNMVLKDSRLLYDSELMANEAFVKGQYTEAIKNYEQGLQSARKIGEFEAIHRILVKLIEIYLNKLPNKELAVHYLQEDLEIQKDYIKDKKKIADTEKIIAQLKVQFHKPREAIEYAKDALELYSEINLPFGQLVSLNLLASANVLLDNKDMAMEYLEDAESLIPFVDDLKVKLQIFLIKGQIFMELERFEESVENYKKALSISDEIMDLSILGNIYNSMGKLHRKWNKYSLAHEYYSRAINIFKKIEDNFNLAMSYFGSALTFKLQNKTDKAIEFFNSALEIGQQEKYLELVGEIYSELAEIYKEKKQIGEAIGKLESLVELKTELGLFKDTDKIYREIENLRKLI
ncbi:MAG: tetratricopeptide repeat protein [Promethearchaeota archaeon]|nr:MAG: tetratricopeptide repeat protein [Candidatus Lokiarchaeota archaeon]